MARPKAKPTKPPQPAQKRTYLKQADVPSASLDEALRVAQAIFDHYAGKSTSPLYVAKALNIDPNGSQLKVLSGAAIASATIKFLEAIKDIKNYALPTDQITAEN